MKKTNIKALACGASLIAILAAAACSSDPDPSGDGDGDTGGNGGEGTGGTPGDGDGDGDATGGKPGGDGDGDGDTGGNGGEGGETGDGDGDEEPVIEEINQIFAGKVLAVDELSGVSIAADGKIYASGTKVVNVGTEEAPVNDKHTALVRFTEAGVLDTTFGIDGVVLFNQSDALTDVQVADSRQAPGNESTRSVLALPDGGAVISINANDGTGLSGTSTYLARVDAAGDLVDSFGSNGIAKIGLTDWTSGTEGWPEGSNPADNVWDIQLDLSGAAPAIVLFGYAPAPVASTRTDIDRYVARVLVSDGSLDTSFAGDGLFSIDFGGLELLDGGRRGVVLEDGTTISSGYTVIGDSKHHIMLLKLDASGVPVADFGFIADLGCGAEQDGVICSNPLLSDLGEAEAYGVAVQEDGRLVTTGYGKPSELATTGPDVVSFRFSNSAMDATYAGVGALIVDSGLEDRGRDIIALEDGRLVHAGKSSALAALFVTDADGALDEDFGDSGIQTYPTHDGNLFDVDSNGGLIASVGSTATTPGAFLVLLQVGE